MKKTIIGLDLKKEYSQISYYNERKGEVETVSVREGSEEYLIPTPKDLFVTTKEAMDLGTMSLANYIRTCISYIQPVPEMENIYLMITMAEMEEPWIHYLKDACEMLGIRRENVCLQNYRESFFCYVINQRKDIWVHSAVLFEYRNEEIISYIMRINHKTRPALVTVTDATRMKVGEQGKRSDREWDEMRDKSFLNMIRETLRDENVSSCFLIGEAFDKSWAVESLQYLCRRRHVFQGMNLYTKGACYGMCKKLNTGKTVSGYLYSSKDLVETNLTMKLDVRGKQTNFPLVNAGINWFDAECSFEMILDHDRELVFTAKSMMGGEPTQFSVPLIDLAERPQRTTRLKVTVAFINAKQCKVRVRDLGFGEFFPASGMTWESILDVG